MLTFHPTGHSGCKVSLGWAAKIHLLQVKWTFSLRVTESKITLFHSFHKEWAGIRTKETLWKQSSSNCQLDLAYRKLASNVYVLRNIPRKQNMTRDTRGGQRMLPRDQPEETEFRAKVADREFEKGGKRVKKWDTNVPAPLALPI